MYRESVASYAMLALVLHVGACGDRGGASPAASNPTATVAAIPHGSAAPPTDPVAAVATPAAAEAPVQTATMSPAEAEPPPGPDTADVRNALGERVKAACSTYLTSRDVKAVCGRALELAIPWGDGDLPGDMLATCSREVARKDGVSPLRLDVRVSEDARSVIQEIESTADESFSVRKLSGSVLGVISTTHFDGERAQLVVVAKGDVLLELHSRARGRQRLPCTDDQLGALAHKVVSRLP